jgi:hypothetical protein
MPKVGYYELRDSPLNMQPKTKIDCETKKHAKNYRYHHLVVCFYVYKYLSVHLFETLNGDYHLARNRAIM